MWVKKPKHGHHNDTLPAESQASVEEQLLGWEAIDVQELFPEEFPDNFDEDEGVRGEDRSTFEQGVKTADEDIAQTQKSDVGVSDRTLSAKDLITFPTS